MLVYIIRFPNTIDINLIHHILCYLLSRSTKTPTLPSTLIFILISSIVDSEIQHHRLPTPLSSWIPLTPLKYYQHHAMRTNVILKVPYSRVHSCADLTEMHTIQNTSVGQPPCICYRWCYSKQKTVELSSWQKEESRSSTSQSRMFEEVRFPQKASCNGQKTSSGVLSLNWLVG